MTTENLNFATESENNFNSENAVNDQEKKEKKNQAKKAAGNAAKFAGAAALGAAGSMAAQAINKPEPDVIIDPVIMGGAATHHTPETEVEEVEEDPIAENVDEISLSQYIEETNGEEGNLGHVDLVEEHQDIMANFDGPAPFSSDVTIDPIADNSDNLLAEIDMNNPVIDDTLLNDDINNDLGAVDNHITDDFSTDLMDDIIA